MIRNSELFKKIGLGLVLLVVILVTNNSSFGQTNQCTITISTSATSGGSFSGVAPNKVFTPTANIVNIQASDLVTQLLTNNVTINTAFTNGTGNGNVTFSAAVTAVTTSTTQRTFTVTAGGSITVGYNIDLTPANQTGNNNGRPATNVVFVAGSSGSIIITAPIITNGGAASGSGTRNGGNAGAISITGPAGITLTSDLTANGGTPSGGAAGTNGNFTINDGATAVTTENGANDGQTAGVISGGNLTKTGAGTFVLAGANIYTGATTISGGVLKLGSSNALGASSGITVNNGFTLDLNGNSSDRPITSIRGTGYSSLGALTNTGGDATWSGNITLVSTATFSSTTTGSLIISGNISGNYALTLGGNGDGTSSGIRSSTTTGGTIVKTGSGTWTLSGANTYTGATTINAGVLSISTIADGGSASGIGQSTNVAANLVLGGGTLRYTGADASTNRAFTLTTGTTSTIDVTSNNLTISGAGANTTGALTKTGAGTLILSGANLYTGLTTVSEGILKYGINNALSSGAVTVNGGTLDIVTFTDNVGAVTLIDGTISGTTGVLTGTSYSVQNGSVSAILAGTASLTKSTAGTVTLSGANTYSGGTTINAGTLSVASESNLGNTSGSLTFANGATLLNNGTGQQTWIRNIILNSGGGIITMSGPTMTLTGNITGGSGLTTGGSDLILNRASGNNLIGTITVNSGRLFVFTGNSINASTISVANGATLDFNISGGYTLPVANNVTFAQGSGLANRQGTLTVSTATVNFPTAGTMILNSDDQPTAPITVSGNYPALTGDLTMQVGGTNTDVGTVTMSGTLSGGTTFSLTKTQTGTLNLGTAAVSLKDLTVSAGALTSTSGTLSLAGNFSNSGIFTHNSGTVNFSGGFTQTISGTASTFSKITIASGSQVNPGGLAHLATNLTLGIVGTSTGIWGSSTSGATYQNDTYFTGIGTINVGADTRATPNITGITASQTITYGTSNVTLSGTVSAPGPVYPASGETVSVTINGSTHNAIISGGAGGFSISFPTSSIPYSATAYAITYAYAGNASLNAAANNASTLTVNRRPVTMTGARAYDGTTVASFGILTVSNIVGSDVVSVASGSGNLVGASVGSQTISSFGTLALGGAAAANYTLTGASGLVTITKAAIAVTANALSKNCGETDPTLTYQITSGTLENGDSFSGSLVRVPGETLGIYEIQQGTLSLSSNYLLNYIGANFTIVDHYLPVLNNLSSKSQNLSCVNKPVSGEYIVSGLGLNEADFSDNCTPDASIIKQYKIVNNGITLVDFGDDTDGDASGYAFPEGVSTITYRVIDLSGNTSSEQSFSVELWYQPGVTNIQMN